MAESTTSVTRQCRKCGTPFEPGSRRSPGRRRTCCFTCIPAPEQRDRGEYRFICAACDIDTVELRAGPRSRFCSACRPEQRRLACMRTSKANRTKKREGRRNVICAQCEKPFYATPRRKFCSVACRDLSTANRRGRWPQLIPLERECAVCGEAFAPTMRANVYCSDACRAKVEKRAASALYRSWYTSRTWRRTRAAQLLAEPLCRMCSDEGASVPAKVCDHVQPHRGDRQRFLAGPFQSLCVAHHNRDKQRAEQASEPARSCLTGGGL